MKNTLRNEMAVCGFAAVKTLEKINAQKITRLYFTEDRAPLFGGLCKKMAASKKPYNQVKDPIELEKLCGWSQTGHLSGAFLPITMWPQLRHCHTQSPSREKTTASSMFFKSLR